LARRILKKEEFYEKKEVILENPLENLIFQKLKTLTFERGISRDLEGLKGIERLIQSYGTQSQYRTRGSKI